MPRGVQLVQLVSDLRAEAGHSSNPALGQQARAGLVRMLQRVQTHLYNDFDWPHLVVDRDVSLSAGQRYYGFPSDLNYERIVNVHTKQGSQWLPVAFGIGPGELSLYDSDAGVRGAPALNWAPYETSQLEVWPIPSEAATLRFRGVRQLGPFAADSDTCDLDSDMIVLFAAAELLGQQKNPRAEKLLSAANALYGKIKGQGGANKRGVWTRTPSAAGTVPGKIEIPFAPRR
ncbi:protein of unknown function [Magnetospirillum sp. XM-1]|uniref:phage adaptor protein n=1 Tax=Magnetospirillum sp. XM-1 TaxID=1663591 RepID=UPI00073DFC2C|nr:hypothetical protein [Magnetospirillum sp. XM-1]CUW38788.1 protein of unknown function [Magnetospirillum sp. XM-1]